tara:strand:+ start:1791 stop:1994 length:204 start_codon:yes stop_codon:yes gene_type:complete
MGLREKLNQKRNIIESNNTKLLSKDSLDQKEITIILNLIKGTTFKGDNLEIMYNLVIKLQNQYTNLK